MENTELKNMIAPDDGEDNNMDIELSSDEDDDNETIMIQNHIEKDLLDKFHPEIKQLNNNEIDSLTKIKEIKAVLLKIKIILLFLL